MRQDNTFQPHAKRARFDRQIQRTSAAMGARMGAKRLSHVAGALFAGVALGIWSLAAAPAKSYPNRLIRLVVPAVAGGPLDIYARAIADKLAVSLKQPLVVENRPGANGNLGAEAIAKAVSDGHTLGMVLASTLTVNPSLYNKLPFDPDKDFRPLAILTTGGNMLIVHPSIPVSSIVEFVAYAKAASARKEPIPYASGGIGGPGHLAMEYFRMHAGFDAVHVPYRGNAPLVVDLLAGHVKAAFVTSAGTMEHVQAGRLRGLGVSNATRSPLAPAIATIAESGFPDFKVENLTVMLAPAGLPEPIATLLERDLQAALRFPDVIERFARD